ncbi:MAG: DUF2860 family protein [Deltaproteobacteria bacterium]|nr:DUF2860 family protein [Deltaproteobacteria bacterium]
MKKAYLTLVFLLSSLTIATISNAGELSAKAGLGIIFINKADNLWGRGKGDNIDLNSAPKSRSRVLTVPMIEAKYKSGSKDTEYYLGALSDEPSSISLGLKNSFGKKSFDAHAFYSFAGSVWEDPYVSNRVRTDMKEYGARLTYTQKEFLLTYRLALVDVQNDVVGSRFSDLKRDGSVHLFKGALRIPLHKGLSLNPGAQYEIGSFRGESNSYTGVGLSLGLNYNAGDLNINTNIHAKKNDFNKDNPIFSEKRQDKAAGASVIATLANPLGFNDFFVSAGLTADKTDSNIRFFDRRAETLFFGAGYKF